MPLGFPPMSPGEVYEAADRLPRVPLAHLPTPLDDAPRFSKAIGDVHVVIKRDDCTGLLLGGNKARHNEFLFGDALDLGCDMVVWGAGVQSNNCRQTAAACAKMGLECRLYLSRMDYKTEPQGNLLLDHLVGAHVEFIDAKIGPELYDFLAKKAAEFRRAGRNPYVFDWDRVVPRAAVSYTICVAEIVEQLHAEGRRPDAIYVSSAAVTGSGVALGAKLLGLDCPVRLIAPMLWPWDIPERTAADATAAAALMGLPHSLRKDEIDQDESYVAPGYGVPSAAGREALDLLARTEAILLDPVYSAKAMAALVADVRAGRYAAGSTVVFIHTGGTPAIFAEPEKVLPKR